MQRRKDDSDVPREPQEEERGGGICRHKAQGPEGFADATRIGERTANPFDESMALSITCHAPFSNLEGSQFLACGVDSLDLSLYVQWSDAWDQQVADLEIGKAAAVGTKGLPVNDGQFLIWPSGMRPNFRWHLQWPGFHLFLSASRKPQKGTPNAYVSINSQTLWQHSIDGAVKLVVEEIEAFAGDVLKIKPSRCDLAADFFLPEDLTLDLITSHRVPSHGQHSHNMKGDRLETFYQGAKKSPVQMRIYDKALEVMRGGTKFWFLDIWQVLECRNIWRVEFQVRRPTLKGFRINSLAELKSGLGGLWKYLTESWFSLRRPDNPNASRRTVHPWWLNVQMCDARFGQVIPLTKNLNETPADVTWFIAHCAGNLLSFAARRRLDNFEDAAKELVREMRTYWARNDYATKYIVKSIQLGHAGSSADIPGNPIVKEDAA